MFCYRQSLALMFEELSVLADRTSENCDSSPIKCEEKDESYLLERKDLMLGSENYSWCARSGMKVIVDSAPKIGQPVPTVSMYNKRSYVSHRTDYSTVNTYESSDTNQLYTSYFSKCNTDTYTPSVQPTQDIDIVTSSSNETQLSQPVQKDKIKQFPAFNGCISYDIKDEPSEHNCESADVSTNEITANKAHIKLENADKRSGESAIDRKMAESAQDLKELEVKLSHSRKRR